MKKLSAISLVLLTAATSLFAQAQVVQEGAGRPVNVSISFGTWIIKLLMSLGWILTASRFSTPCPSTSTSGRRSRKATGAWP
jgi:hypothetical protein